MSQRKPKGSVADEARQAAVHSTKALFTWKTALHLLSECLHYANYAVSLFTCEFTEQHALAHAPAHTHTLSQLARLS